MDNERYKPYRIFDKRWRIVYGPGVELRDAFRTTLHHVEHLAMEHPLFQRLYRGDVIHGFVPDRSFVTHAAVHRDAGTVVAMDLYHAFEKTTQESVVQALERIGLDPGIISFLRSSFINGELPTGFPTSPMLFNLALLPMDLELVDFSTQRGLRYSRYADDIAFSKRPERSLIDQEDIDEAMQIIRNYGYDPHKIKIGHPRLAPFEICGLSLYKGRVTLPGRAVRKARAQLYTLIEKTDPPDYRRALSLIAHIKSVRPLPPNLEKYERSARSLLEEERTRRRIMRKEKRKFAPKPSF